MCPSLATSSISIFVRCFASRANDSKVFCKQPYLEMQDAVVLNIGFVGRFLEIRGEW